MSDNTTVHIGENSPEEVAFKLMGKIAHADGVVLAASPINGRPPATRDWILNTYSECIRTVTTGYRPE